MEQHAQSQRHVHRETTVSTIQEENSLDFHHNHVRSEMPAPFTPQTTTSSLATQESGLSLDEIETHLRATPARGDESELEISQKTWSAYETLPRGITHFRSDRKKEWLEGQQTNTIDISQCESETVNNDSHASSTEMLSPTDDRDYMYVARHSGRHIWIPSRFSIASSTSTDSGYVISSLNSPGPLGPRTNRISCYSTGSDDYVISLSEWMASKPTIISQEPALPSIAEDSPLHSEYIQVLP